MFRCCPCWGGSIASPRATLATYPLYTDKNEVREEKCKDWLGTWKKVSCMPAPQVAQIGSSISHVYAGTMLQMLQVIHCAASTAALVIFLVIFRFVRVLVSGFGRPSSNLPSNGSNLPSRWCLLSNRVNEILVHVRCVCQNMFFFEHALASIK